MKQLLLLPQALLLVPVNLLNQQLSRSSFVKRKLAELQLPRKRKRKLKDAKPDEEDNIVIQEDTQEDESLDDEDPDAETYYETFAAVDAGIDSGVDSDDDEDMERHTLPSLQEHDSKEDADMDFDEPDNGLEIKMTPPPKSVSSPIKHIIKATLDCYTDAQHHRVSSLSPSKGVKAGIISPAKGKRLGSFKLVRAIANDIAYPAYHHDYIVDVLRKTAVQPELAQVFSRLLANPDTLKLVTTYMGYGRSGLLTFAVGRARSWVTSFYNLPGRYSPAEVKDIVGFLHLKGHFKYGEVDLESHTWNKKLPFGCEGISHLLRAEFFATKGGANIAAFKEMIEHALSEYAEGALCHIEFSNAACSRNQSNKAFLLDVEADDMDDIDIAALEAEAISAAAAQQSLSAISSLLSSETVVTSTTSQTVTPSSSASISSSVITPSSATESVPNHT
ncbi:hypothetical protein BT96DRAFT_949621 [Gymnopus androsaceus JB14]|uniref:DUF6532 domain-containing protein n=1 Tax=Gymnopus androsaceus JB14 TaxID=1447944 RepID=A0A6A4GKH4_9AGAR|nr:hypothetical protein BT96DRAFT_949621 [Gymnopus androsaceus JB14]